MKKLKTLLLALAAGFLTVPDVQAQVMIGGVVAPEDLADGMDVVFEARSGTSSAGHYLVPWDFQQSSHPCETIESILTPPQRVQWTLVKAQIPNQITGRDQYYIKSKANGKYITYRTNEDGTKVIRSGATVSFVSDTTDAVAFCFVSNSDEELKGQYGSVHGGSVSSNWENTTYTICSIFPKNGNLDDPSSMQWGRMFLANEFEISNYNITWFSKWNDTNVWDVRSLIDRSASPKEALQALLDNFPANVDEEYKVGTDPGFVDQELFDSFYEIYQNALSGMDNMSDEELVKTFDELYKAKTAIDNPANRIQIKDGGYYYIKPANNAFTSVDNGEYGWTAPYEGDIAGWKALDVNDNRFVWQITEYPDTTEKNTSGRMYYAFRNVGGHVYLGKASSHADSQPVGFTNEKVERITVKNLGSGQFNISSKYDFYDAYPPRPYHMENHQNGNGKAGKLVLWNGELNSASAWYIREVPQDIVDHINDPARLEIDSTRIAVRKYDGITNGAEVGDGVGFAHSQKIIDDVNNALALAKSLSDTVANPLPDAETVRNARLDLVKKAEAFNNEVNIIPDGYYRFRSNMALYVQNMNEIYLSLYNDTTPGWKNFVKSTEQVWKLKNLPGGGYTIQNVKNKMYLNKAEESSNGYLVNMTAEPETVQRLAAIKANGKWGIFNEVDSTFGYDPNGHLNGMAEEGKLQIWSPRDETGGTSWSLESLSEEEVNNLVASEEQNQRDILLKKKFEEARRIYNSATNYKRGEPIIKEVGQIYVNNWSPNEGAHIENIIDGDKNTYWNSTWEAGGEQDPGNPHYLRVYDEAGFPDTVQVEYVMRQNASWHRVPAKMRIQVSNDSENWQTLPNDMHLADFGGHEVLDKLHTDSLHYIVSGIGGYKYVRFITMVSINNGGGVYFANNHAVFGYAEYNLYPVTGVDENSFIQMPTHKDVAYDLFNAIQAAKAENENGNASQATIDRLTAAIEAFKNLDINDSTVAMARFNVNNLTAGTAVGEFPDAALETYVNKAESLLKTIDDAGDNVPSATINAAVAELKDAYAELYKTMVRPEQNKWYIVKAADPEKQDMTFSAGGPYSHVYNSGYSYVLEYESDNLGSIKPGMSWTINEDSTGRYVLQNARTGGYFGPYTNSGNSKYDYHPIMWYQPKSFTIVPLGEGQIGFVTAEGYYIKGSTGDIVMNYQKAPADYNMKNTGYAWTIEPTEEQHADLAEKESRQYAAGRVIAFTKAYSIEGLPMASNSDAGVEEIPGYEIMGKEVSGEDTNMVTAYKLRALENDGIIPAGKPVIYILPGEFGSDVLYDVTFTPSMNTALKLERDTVNGLVSVASDDWSTSEAHMGYFLGDSVVDEPINLTIGYQRAVIVPRFVQELSDEEPDAIVYVKGAGMLNGIKKTEIVAVKKFVNVYTVDGVPVRKHVDAATATEGLKKGIYVVGNRKVLVR